MTKSHKNIWFLMIIYAHMFPKVFKANKIERPYNHAALFDLPGFNCSRHYNITKYYYNYISEYSRDKLSNLHTTTLSLNVPFKSAESRYR